MPTKTSTPSRSSTRPKGAAAVLAAIVPAAIVASILDAIVAAIAHGAGVSHSFKPLQTSSYVSLTVIGVVIGAVGWLVVRSRASNPRRTLSRLVPIVLIISFVPDIGVGMQKSMTGTTWGGVAALMIMHLIVAAVAVASYTRFLPVGDTATT